VLQPLAWPVSTSSTFSVSRKTHLSCSPLVSCLCMPFSQPMPLGRKAEPFDHSEWIYELKYDGFRALAVVEYGTCTLFSRNGHPFASFSELASRIGYGLMPRSVVMDGEIVCLDDEGRCQFNDLLFRRGETRFVAFDLLQVNGKDLRAERLIDRKHELRRVTPGVSSIIYAEHIERSGIALFDKACELDLEGIVAKDGRAPYDRRQTTWFKIRNREYSQMVGREEVFERERHQEPVAGWHSCSLACGEPEL
jgi:bifunctional non-homologous end joining protein LigD